MSKCSLKCWKRRVIECVAFRSRGLHHKLCQNEAAVGILGLFTPPRYITWPRPRAAWLTGLTLSDGAWRSLTTPDAVWHSQTVSDAVYGTWRRLMKYDDTDCPKPHTAILTMPDAVWIGLMVYDDRNIDNSTWQ